MLTPRPESNIQVLAAVTDRHVIPVIDIDNPGLKQLYLPAQSAVSLLTGTAAPTAYAAAVAATLVADSVAADSDLTFTAVAAGTGAHAYTIAIVQAVSLNAPLSVVVDGFDIVITLPSDGAGAPVAKTATEVKAAWDAVAAAVAIATVAVEGTGAGTVDGSVAANMAGGSDEVLATGTNLSPKGAIYTKNTNPVAVYVNKGTLAAPVWEAA